MNKWVGAAGVIINEHAELLMVLQGKPHEEKKWSVPAGGLEVGETFEECCIREIEEETGYKAEVADRIYIKEQDGIEHGQVEVHYFLARLVGGEMAIQDPDELIHEIDWKSLNDLQTLNFAFPEDRDFLTGLVEGRLPLETLEQ